MEGGLSFSTSDNLIMDWLFKKLTKFIGEHKFLYLFILLLFLWHSNCLSYQWNIVHRERKSPGTEPEI